jgi:5-formyltetrahydrofolate cyclo-ligase
MKAHELKAAKRRVRRAVLARRDALSSSDREERSGRIHARFLDLPEVERASTVSLFWSFGSEVGTGPLIDALHRRGVRILLPRIVEGDLELRGYRPGDPLDETPFGAREPTAGPAVNLAEVEAICTPAVAFDRTGARIGYGGGYYDRLFTRAPRARRIGIAFAVQVVDEPLPAGAFDRRVDVLVTEEETLRWAR